MTLKRIVTTDTNLQTLQDNVSAALAAVEGNPFQGGLLLSGISLQSGDNAVSHKLSRQPQGWLLTDCSAAITVYRTGWDSKALHLQASGGATVSLWVF